MGEGTRFLKMNLLSDKDLTENQIKTNQEYTVNSLNKREISHHYDISNYYPVRIEARPQVMFHSTSYMIRLLGAAAPIHLSHMCLQCP